MRSSNGSTEGSRQSSKTTTSILPSMSDPTPPPRKGAADLASSPQSAEKEKAAPAKESGSGSGSGYGTRSRNRTGASRPNYAETTEIDAEIELYQQSQREARSGNAASSRKSDEKHGSAAQSQSESQIQSQDQSHAQDGSGNGNTSISKNHHNSPSTPSSAATTSNSGTTVNGSSSTTNSKKRKAASASSTSSSQTTSQQGSQSQASTAVHSSSLQKRLGAASLAAANGNGASNSKGNGSQNGTGRSAGFPETNMLTFENSRAIPKDGKLLADDGTVLSINDHVYLVCEPPGEPYYLARIMEWVHVQNDLSKAVDSLRVNWYYRPKDIGRKVQDTRLVLATMHSDTCPLTSLRGKCEIRHRAEIPDLTEYKRQPDCFWFEKLYERYIQKNYEVIPTSQVVNVPDHVKKVLDERWRFILVEQGRGKELTSARKRCIKCENFCASNESVDCAVCQHTYHMYCVKPALQKKPSRGFAWSCAACSRAQERKLEARNTPNFHDPNAKDGDVEEEELIDEDDEEPSKPDTNRTSPAEDEYQHAPPTEEQIYQASLWPYRYLGMHCKLEDALDYDDRVFPRASTRLGQRHQANVLPWPGRTVEYVKPLEFKRSKKDGKPNKEAQALIEAEKKRRENKPWIQDAPPGWVERGGDDTAELKWKPPQECGSDVSIEHVTEYVKTAQALAPQLGLPERSTNLSVIALYTLFENNYDAAKSLQVLPTLDKAVFQEPELSPAEQKKFEEGVAKFGSELHSVKKHVKTVSPGDITRYYYTWKKTERGKQIWGNYAGRKGKKDSKRAEAAANKLADDVADDHDDSAFDAEKAVQKKKAFMCKFCGTKHSRQWRRAPNVAHHLGDNGAKNKDKKGEYIPALCRRCAELWRRYAIQWEDMDEMAKKVAQTGGRGWRKKVDEELLKELHTAEEMMNNTRYSTPDPSASVPVTQEPPRKKLKSGIPDKDVEMRDSDSGSVSAGPATKKKEKVAEKAAPAPAPPQLVVPEMPKPRTMPCAICMQKEPLGDQHLSCKECRMTVHRNCYGVIDNRAPGKWTCDMCQNDKAPQVSIRYECVLCTVKHTEHDFVEPPKNTHKKKTEKDRERERQEREYAQKAAEFYRMRQVEMNRPVDPREPLKRTADNNWVHVTCATWTPEVKFGNAKALSPSEGIPSIPRARYAEECLVCQQTGGACVSCTLCKAPMHVECAHQAGHIVGFDITPVKGSRRDQHNSVTVNGETGIMSAGIWCKEHLPLKTTVHPMYEIVDESGMNALQLFVQNFKQADLTLTGCARKANQISLAAKMTCSPAPVSSSSLNRRASTTTLVNGDNRDQSPTKLQHGGKVCCTCGTDVSLRWHPIDQAQERGLVNGHHGTLGETALKFVEQRKHQCHKCKKAGRQPESHVPFKKEPSPSPMPEPAPILTRPVTHMSNPPPVTSPAPIPSIEQRSAPLHAPRAFSWSQSPRASVAAPPANGPIVPAPAGLQAPPIGSIGPSLIPPVQPPPPVAPPLAQTMSRGPPPPIQAPQVTYGPPPPWFNSRPSTASGPPPLRDPHRELNSHPPPTTIPPPMAPSLRPPPLPPHHAAPPPLTNGVSHIVQPPPFANGTALPPHSPRRTSGGPPPVHGYPHHAHVNGTVHPVDEPPPVQRSYYTSEWARPPPVHHSPPATHHYNPPLPREPAGLPHMRPGRESIPPPPGMGVVTREREREPPRPATGASSNPSLRNLLS